MLGIIRMVASIIASLCVVAVPFVGIYAGWFYVIFLGIGVLVFFMLALLLKNIQEEKENDKEKNKPMSEDEEKK